MTTSYIRIAAGTYRSNDVSGQAFQLVEQYKVTGKGGHVTVKNGGKFPGFPEDIRVKVTSPKQYSFITEAEFLAEGNAPVAVGEAVAETASLTEEEVMQNIRERFEILDEMAQAAVDGNVRALIVSGPPGIGKSHGIERIVEKATLFDQVAGHKLRGEVIKGSATAIGLYQALYKYSDEKSILVFDDCDSIFYDDVSLNLLKGALDSGKKRRISWLAESSTLRNQGIPDNFNFNGSIIFITNMKFDNTKGKLKEHMEALQSRCHYLDLKLDTMRERLLRIKQVAADGELFADYNFEEGAEDEIFEFLSENQNRMREISLRMAKKVADLRKSFPLKWRSIARQTCMKAA